MVDLYVKFKEIKKMGYVRSYKDKNNSGITFEHLLGKEQDEFFLPDYNGIELKKVIVKLKLLYLPLILMENIFLQFKI